MNKILKTILIFLGVCLFIVKLFSPTPPLRQSIDDIVADDLSTIAAESGILYKHEKPYLSSIFGRGLRNYTDKGPVPGRSWRIERFHLAVRSEKKGIRTIYIIKVELDDNYSYGYYDSGNAKATTHKILLSVTAGSEFWSALSEKMKIRDRINRSWLPSYNWEVLKLPDNQRELLKYRKRLAALLGSETMLMDGWGHSIKLTLDDKHSPTLIIASSAGSDGVWGTKDDLTIVRDTKTHKFDMLMGMHHR